MSVRASICLKAEALVRHVGAPKLLYGSGGTFARIRPVLPRKMTSQVCTELMMVKVRRESEAIVKWDVFLAEHIASDTECANAGNVNLRECNNLGRFVM
jgi:hypothetical protein